jgi:hypothetical protein
MPGLSYAPTKTAEEATTSAPLYENYPDGGYRQGYGAREMPWGLMVTFGVAILSLFCVCVCFVKICHARARHNAAGVEFDIPLPHLNGGVHIQAAIDPALPQP